MNLRNIIWVIAALVLIGSSGRATQVLNSSGYIDTGDEYSYTVSISQSGTLHAWTTGSTDTYGRLLTSSGSELTYDDDSGEGSNFDYSYSVTAGTYRVVVHGYNHTSTGSFSVYADFTASGGSGASAASGGSFYDIQVVGSTSGSVWGSGPYTDDSNVAAAAVHAGLISVGQSATIRVYSLPGQSSYSGSTRNGVTTMSYGAWGGSISLELLSGGGGNTPPQIVSFTVTPTTARRGDIVAVYLNARDTQSNMCAYAIRHVGFGGINPGGVGAVPPNPSNFTVSLNYTIPAGAPVGSNEFRAEVADTSSISGNASTFGILSVYVNVQQPQSGTVSGSGYGSFSFNVPAGASNLMVWTHTACSGSDCTDPGINLSGAGGSWSDDDSYPEDGSGPDGSENCARGYNSYILVASPAGGTYSVSCWRQQETVYWKYTTGAAPSAPVITSASTAGGAYNSSFSYTITASNSPTSFGATGLPTGLSVNPATGVISGTPTAVGTFSVGLSATNAGGTGTASLSLSIAKAAQTISFGALANKISNDPPFTVSAAASSGLPVSFSIVSGPATISGATVTLTGGTGTVTIRASQPGNASFNAAPNVEQAFSVTSLPASDPELNVHLPSAP